MKNIKRNFLSGIIMAVVCLLAGSSFNANAQSRRTQATLAHAPETQQPLYAEYKGVRLGMTAEEVRTKLGAPLLKADDGDFYAFTENENAQFVYDAERKVRTISVDYLNAVGAPDPKAVIGGELEMKNGSAYKMVQYPSRGFWVSYNRTSGPVTTVTITIQKM